MVRKTTPSNDEWVAAYESRRIHQSRYTKKLESLLIEILEAKQIGFHLIEARTKDIESFREKISRTSKAYNNPLEEITDLTGLRIITYYQNDAMLIGEAIESEFEIDETHSVKHAPVDSEFGYRSAHYIVTLKASRTDLIEWAGLSSFKAEIQVRTVLQHAWAAISHKLQYKRENDVPKSLRRKLFRLSALFELADDEFMSLRDASEKLAEEIELQITEGAPDIPIDHLSISQFISQSLLISELSDMAAEAGFKFERSRSDDVKVISDLIQLITRTKLKDLTEIHATLNNSLPWAQKYLQEQLDACIASGSANWTVSDVFICMLIIIRSQIAFLQKETLYELGWNHEIASRVYEIAKNFKQ